MRQSYQLLTRKKSAILHRSHWRTLARKAPFFIGSIIIMDTDIIREISLPQFPVNLQNMHKPPGRLWYRGRFPAPADHKYLCIVGSCKWTPYGRDALKLFMRGLRGYPITVVSGLAIGIDSLAHRAALEAGLNCIAFPGSSLEWDRIYPPTHVNLAREIVAAGGALVSKWTAADPTGKWMFPERNMLMAGISDGTLIVEAAHRSGSLLTANHALEYGREVMAVPGPIASANSYGPHMLISTGGARLVATADDVLAGLGIEPVAAKADSPAAQIAHAAAAYSLDALSRKIIECLMHERLTANQLISATGADVSEIAVRISELEIERLVEIEQGRVRLSDYFHVHGPKSVRK